MKHNLFTNEELYAAVCNLRQALTECIADFKYEGIDGWMEGQMHSVDYKVAVMMLEKTAKYDTE